MLAQATGGGSSVILFFFISIAVATDVVRHRIPNLLVVIMLSCGIMLGASLLQTTGVAAALLGALVGFLMLIPFYLLGGMGAGDVKLLAAIGSFLGPWGALVAGVVTLMAGGILGLVAILWRNALPVLMVRFSPILRSTPERERGLALPYAIPIAVGTISAVIYAEDSTFYLNLLGGA